MIVEDKDEDALREDTIKTDKIEQIVEEEMRDRSNDKLNRS